MPAAILLLDKVLQELREALALDGDATEAYLFGSIARGDYTLESDIDLLVLSRNPKKTRRRLEPVLDRLYLELLANVSLIVIGEDAWKGGLSMLKGIVEKEGKLVWRRG